MNRATPLRAGLIGLGAIGRAVVRMVSVEGAFGRLEVRIENVPSIENPRTGRIVAMSVVRALLDRREPLVIG